MSENVVSLRSLINPFPRQEEFLKSIDQYKYVLYGGAKGGGKSRILRWALVRFLLQCAKNGQRRTRVALFCEDYPSLKDRQITKVNREFPAWLGILSDSSIEGLSFILKPEFGSGIIAFRNLDDPSKYASSEFAAVAIDELTKNQREVFDQLRSIVRWPGIPHTPIMAGSNPGDIGHAWVKKLWVDRDFTDEDPDPNQVFFVKSLPTDNPHNTAEYIKELKRLPEKLRKAYLEGNWDTFLGQYFTEWNREHHIVKPFVIPSFWKKFRAYDYGYEAPACCKWYALDGEGRIWVYREKYFKKGHKLEAEKQAQEILALSKGETYEYSIADPAIFSPTGMVDKSGGQTISETFARVGVTFIPASNRRVDGWDTMHKYLYWDDKQEPKIKYFNICFDSIRTIPTLVHDPIKSNDLDTDGEDHAADVDRYMLTSLHERKSELPKTETENIMERIKERQGGMVMTPSVLNNFYQGNYHRNNK